MSRYSSKTVHSLAEIDNDSIEQLVVSFDLFDTLLRRKFLAVNEVHDTVSAFILAKFGKFSYESPGNLTLARYNTGNFLKMSPHTSIEEPTLTAIWERVLEGIDKKSLNNEKLIEHIIQYEFDIEMQNLGAVQGAQSLLKSLKQAGKQIVATSDMYFSGNQIAEFLKQNHLYDYFDYIFVSSDEGVTKQTGNLFKIIYKTLKVEPADVLHVGDNLHSDIIMGQKAGMSVIHVDQQPYLQLERPNYGQRADIYSEISDLVKLFLLKMRINTLSADADHIFFASRDGLLLHEIWENWQWPLLNSYLRNIKTSDMFLSRSSSCWLAVNFNTDWLPQAIGFAFWLCHGEASASQLSELLGITEVPSALGDNVFKSSLHTDYLVSIYRTEGLESCIKSALLKKRRVTEAYLKSIGFLSSRRVGLCDIGYSGTVARDLNSYFLQESLRPSAISAPIISLSLLATNNNYETNAIIAKPYVSFDSRPILKHQNFPAALTDSYAWLEYFFKHPTFGPVTGYSDLDGDIQPKFSVNSQPDYKYPSQLVAAESHSKEEDIVLLWMASVNHWDFFVDPLIKRFELPDLPMIEQMKAPIYEQDAVSGKSRSILLIAPERSAAEIYQIAKNKDYWITGSIVASTRSKRISIAKVPQSIDDDKQRKRRLFSGRGRAKRFLKRRLMLIRMSSNNTEVNVNFYRSYHPDLQSMSDAALLKHYFDYGRKEKRPASADELIMRLEEVHGLLPIDFDADEYRRLNPDLPVQEEWWLKEHYLVFGRREERPYQSETNLSEQDFHELITRGHLSLNVEEKLLADSGVSISRILCVRADIKPGSWVSELHYAEFQAINSHWAGHLISKAHAFVMFLEQGLEILAPLRLSLVFDVDYYRYRNPALSSLDDKKLYKYWLEYGLAQGEAPSEAARISHLIGRTDFPSAFSVREFADRHLKLSVGHDRIDTLETFLQGAFADSAEFIQGPETSSFWMIYAKYAHKGGRTLTAAYAYHKALAAGEPGGRIWHQLGNIALHEDRFADALECYRNAVSSTNADRWAYIEGAKLAARLGDFSEALVMLRAGREFWGSKEPWRRAHQFVLQSWFNYSVHILGDLKTERAQSTFFANLDRISEIVSEDMPTIKRNTLKGTDIIVVGQKSLLEEWYGDGAFRKEVLKDHFHANLRLFDISQIDSAIAAMPWAGQLILLEVLIDLGTIRIVQLSRALGIRTTYCVGSLTGGDSSPFRRPSSTQIAELLEFPRAKYAMSLCEFGQASLPAAIQVLEKYTVSRQAHFCARLPSHKSSEDETEELVTIIAQLSSNDRAFHDRCWKIILEICNDFPNLSIVINTAGSTPTRWPASKRLQYARLSRFDIRTFDFLDKISGILDFSSKTVRGQTPHILNAFDAAACGVAYLAIDENTRAFRPKLFVTLSSWRNASRCLRQFIGSKPERVKLAQAARAEFETQHISNVLTEKTWSSDQSLSVIAARRTRVLFANVFFAPQVIGGATRVLKDNIDFFVKNLDVDYDFGVLCSDDENDQPGKARLDSYKGIPVFRISTPQELDMDWRTFNATVEQYCLEVFKLFKPDIVHIHCIQRLSVAVAEACIKAGVPYVVTLHDAWWLSDYSFLVDEDGQLCLPKNDLMTQKYSSRIGLYESVARGRRLRAALSHAAHIIGVSESFSNLYRKCGFDVETIANGVSEMPAINRTGNRVANVKLLHVGGTQHHKGAYLIEAALRANSFENLELTVVNHFLDHGDQVRTFWGKTLVNIVGKYPADKIWDLYSSADVVIAPSTWPESFGLVSREALASGCWVIASSLGAMGDEIDHGKNGFLLKRPDAGELANILRIINSSPGIYKIRPESKTAFRSSDDQALDLAEFYKKIVGKTK